MRRVLVGAGAAALAAALAVLLVPAGPPPDPSGEGVRGTVRVLRDGAELEVSGPLAAAMLPLLQAALAAGARTVQLDSAGGPAAVAETLAGAIRAAGADTAVTDRCYSACVALFLAGGKRWIGPFAQLGLEPGARLAELYRRAGVPAVVLQPALATPQGQAWFPDRADLLGTGMATELAAPDQFALAGFGPVPTPDTIRARLLSVRDYRIVAERDPAGFEADLLDWTDAVLRGHPGTAAFATTTARLEAMSARALSDAPDDVLEDHARLFIAELAWMQHSSPADCPAFAASQGRAAGPTDPDLVARRAALNAMLLAQDPVPHEAVAATRLLQVLAQGGVDDPGLLLNRAGPPGCDVIRQVWALAASVRDGPRLLVRAGM